MWKWGNEYGKRVGGVPASLTLVRRGPAQSSSLTMAQNSTTLIFLEINIVVVLNKKSEKLEYC